MKNQKGFTLIELLLVLAIIGIIAAIAIPALLGQREKAKAKAVQSMVVNVAGECSRISDSRKEQGLSTDATVAGDTVAQVVAMPNYIYPNAKNPYGGVGNPYVNGASATAGTVALVAGTTTENTRVFPSITITGNYTEGGVAATSSKIVALD